MSLKDYLKSKVGIILLNITGLITLSIFLFSVGNEFKTIMTIGITWITVLLIHFMYEYKKRKSYFEIIEKCVSNIDKKYLISEVLEVPPFVESIPYYYLLKNQANP